MFYNDSMILLSVQGQGAIYSLCILFFCIVIVHIVKLTIIGWRAFRKREPKKQQEPPPEPVYYIVEKKKNTAPQYKKPRKINFQK